MVIATRSEIAADPILSALSLLMADGATHRPKLTGHDGTAIELPDDLYQVLETAVREMRAGNSVTLVPLSQRISTQEAAELLGLSRPTLVKLLENGEIPYEQPGRHRRLLLTDVLAYRTARHNAAIQSLDQISAEANEAGLYDTTAEDYAATLKRVRKRRRSIER